MRFLSALLLCLLPSCLQIDHNYLLLADGSGRVDIRWAWNAELLAPEQQQQALLGAHPHPVVPFDLDALLAECEGVTGLSEVRTSLEEGWVVHRFSLWFDDIDDFRMPALPARGRDHAQVRYQFLRDTDQPTLRLLQPLTAQWFSAKDLELVQRPDFQQQVDTPIHDPVLWKGFRLGESYHLFGHQVATGGAFSIDRQDVFRSTEAVIGQSGEQCYRLDRLQELADRRGTDVDFRPDPADAVPADWAAQYVAAKVALDRRVGPWLRFVGGQGPGHGKEIVLVSGDEEYRSEEALPMLARILAMRYGFSCTVLFSQDPDTGKVDPENRSYIPGLDQLDHADLLVLFTRFRTPDDAAMQALHAYRDSGRPIIGLRTATHAFLFPKESPWASWSWNAKEPSGGFGREILGETWVAHHGAHGRESTRGLPDPAAAGHPILRGVAQAWGPTDVYRIRDLPGDATVLLRGYILSGMSPDDPIVEDARNDPAMPVSWIRETPLPNGTVRRVYTSTLACSQDFLDQGVRRTFIQACFWCLGLEDAIPDQGLEVGILGPYQATRFGFGAQQQGLSPKGLGRGVPFGG